MKLNRKEILAIVASHQANLDKKAINPIFSSLRFFCDGQNLKISSMDGERFLTHKFKVDFNPFDIFLPGVNLYDLLRKSKSEFFEVVEEEKEYVFKIDKGEFKFSKLESNSASMPEWIGEFSNKIELNAQDLKNGLKLVKNSCSNDDSRPFLNGVCFDFNNGYFNLCATDTLRLCLYSSKSDCEGKWIFSKKTVNDLIKLLEDVESPVTLSIGKNAKFEFVSNDKNVELNTLLIPGQFPNYNRLIRDESEYSSIIKTNVEYLSSSLDRILTMANLHQPVVKFNFANESMIAAENAISRGEEVLEVDYSGSELSIAFNGRLLSEMLSNFSGDIQIYALGPQSPILIKGKDQDNLTGVVAPVKRS